MQQSVSSKTGDIAQVCNTLFPWSFPPLPDSYTDEEFDLLLEIEKDWRDSRPRYTFFELMEIFPTAIPAARRGIRAKIKEVKENISKLDDHKERYYEGVINKAPFKDQARMIVDFTERFKGWMDEQESEMKKYHVYLNHLDKMAKPPEESATPVVRKPDTIDNTDIERARMVPIAALIKVTPMKKALCLWHTDRHPSMHVYKDHAYCFVCNKHADAIDIVMARYNLKFVEAVQWLNNL